MLQENKKITKTSIIMIIMKKSMYQNFQLTLRARCFLFPDFKICHFQVRLSTKIRWNYMIISRPILFMNSNGAWNALFSDKYIQLVIHARIFWFSDRLILFMNPNNAWNIPFSEEKIKNLARTSRSHYWFNDISRLWIQMELEICPKLR